MMHFIRPPLQLGTKEYWHKFLKSLNNIYIYLHNFIEHNSTHLTNEDILKNIEKLVMKNITSLTNKTKLLKKK